MSFWISGQYDGETRIMPDFLKTQCLELGLEIRL